MKALDLFCGAGGASKGLAMAGYSVTGMDINPQPNYPFTFIQADVMSLTGLTGFDLVWASPPCQAYTNAQKIRGRKHPDLIEPVRDLLKRSGVPYVIENVPGAPLENPTMLCGSMFPDLKTYRHRLFECSFKVWPLPHPPHSARTAKMGRKPKEGEFMHVVGNFSGVEQARVAMGISWMTRDELREAIPPQFAYYIATCASSARNVLPRLREQGG